MSDIQNIDGLVRSNLQMVSLDDLKAENSQRISELKPFFKRTFEEVGNNAIAISSNLLRIIARPIIMIFLPEGYFAETAIIAVNSGISKGKNKAEEHVGACSEECAEGSVKIATTVSDCCVENTYSLKQWFWSWFNY